MDRQELFAKIQYPLPQHAISRLIGKLAESRIGWIKDPFIRHFIKHYGVDMSQAQEPDPGAYACFNDFFTRALKPDRSEEHTSELQSVALSRMPSSA